MDVGIRMLSWGCFLVEEIVGGCDGRCGVVVFGVGHTVVVGLTEAIDGVCEVFRGEMLLIRPLPAYDALLEARLFCSIEYCC